MAHKHDHRDKKHAAADKRGGAPVPMVKLRATMAEKLAVGLVLFGVLLVAALLIWLIFG